jgi:hypothetical protein
MLEIAEPSPGFRRRWDLVHLWTDEAYPESVMGNRELAAVEPEISRAMRLHNELLSTFVFAFAPRTMGCRTFFLDTHTKSN